MKVGAIRIEEMDGGARARVVASVTYANATKEDYWFEYPREVAEALTTDGNAWVALLLPLAMHLDEPLEVDGAVDQTLFQGLERLQGIWRCWNPALHQVKVLPRAIVTKSFDEDRRAGSFFSGGVDSFYSAICHQADGGVKPFAKDLIFVWGFDISLAHPELIERLRPGLAEASAGLGAELIIASTNIRQTRWRETNWAELSHGAALAAVGLCLEGRFSHLLIPSTESYRELYAWGSHALTDPLFSSGRMRVHHDGAESSRLEKVRRLTSSPLAMKSLRVCWQSSDAMNCGRCQKCQRTMLQLEILGALESCEAFSQRTIDVDRVRRVFIEWDLVPDYREIREHAMRQGRRDIARAVDYALLRSKAVEFGLDLAQRLRRLPKGHLLARPLQKYLYSASIR